MPADVLTKAMPAGKFSSMLTLLNMGINRPAAALASLAWSKGVLAAMVLSLAVLLKGQAHPQATGRIDAVEPADASFWGWVITGVFVVILSWEGVKSLLRCLLSPSSL